MSAPTRPLLRWFGGKWKLAPWVLQSFPTHRVYVEAFGGAASLLLRKQPAYAEVYNDLDDEVVNLFRVLRGDRAGELIAALGLTPFARTEFFDAYHPTGDEVERARQLVVRSFMGFGSDSSNVAIHTGFRSTSNRSGTTPAHDWKNYPQVLRRIIERLRGVVIENHDAAVIMRSHDGARTLHYVDPPYLPETRSKKFRKAGGRYHSYVHEMEEADHVALLECLRSLKGMVVLSGYPSALYDQALADWQRVETSVNLDGAHQRTERLWLNPACVAGLEKKKAGCGAPLFEAAAR